jgi:hypothetical protein
MCGDDVFTRRESVKLSLVMLVSLMRAEQKHVFLNPLSNDDVRGNSPVENFNERLT